MSTTQFFTILSFLISMTQIICSCSWVVFLFINGNNISIQYYRVLLSYHCRCNIRHYWWPHMVIWDCRVPQLSCDIQKKRWFSSKLTVSAPWVIREHELHVTVNSWKRTFMTLTASFWASQATKQFNLMNRRTALNNSNTSSVTTELYWTDTIIQCIYDCMTINSAV